MGLFVKSITASGVLLVIIAMLCSSLYGTMFVISKLAVPGVVFMGMISSFVLSVLSTGQLVWVVLKPEAE